MAGSVHTGLVDVLIGSHAHFKHPHGFPRDNGENAVQDETIHFFFDQDWYLVDLQTEVQHALRCFIGDMGSLDHFHELHDECRIEEMEVADLGGSIRNIRDAGTNNERTIRGQNGFGWSELIQIGEDFPL